MREKESGAEEGVEVLTSTERDGQDLVRGRTEREQEEKTSERDEECRLMMSQFPWSCL